MIKRKYKGHFIVIEGTDGSGKATQVKLLQKKFQTIGVPHQLIAFPRYTGNPYGKLIGRYLKGEFGAIDEVNNSLISLAYAGDRFLAKPIIEEWLQKGNLVIADRYVPSNKAYMAAKMPEEKRQDFIEWLDDLEYNINGIPREELVIFLNVPVEVGKINVGKKHERDYIKKGTSDIHERDLKYQKESSKMYLSLSKQEPNWIIISCAKNGLMCSKEEINQEIIKTLMEKKILK